MSQPYSATLAQADLRIFYEFARVASMDEWWHWLLLLLGVTAAMVVIVVIYGRDNVELPRGIGWLLISLRIYAIAVLLLFFLDPQKRSEQRVVKNSRAVLLVDTSQSMALRDGQADSGERQSRSAEIATRLPEFVENLRKAHDVFVYQFDETEQPRRLASFEKVAPAVSDQSTPELSKATLDRQLAGRLSQLALWLFLAALAGAVVHGVLRSASRDRQRYAVFASGLLWLGSLSTFAVGDAMFAELFWDELPLIETDRKSLPPATPLATPAHPAPPTSESSVDWPQALNPTGVGTHIGDALVSLVRRERGGPISGIGLFTDGNQNGGTALQEAAAIARDANIAVVPVGVGSDRRPVNVRLAELEAPLRVYPGDSFPARVYLQSFGLAGQSVRVEFLEVNANSPNDEATFRRLDEHFVRLGPDGETTTVEFEIRPTKAGRRLYAARVLPPGEDSDPQDNLRRTAVTVVDQKNRVLLLAGGPSREYQFLRVQLFRDPEVVVDVHLQGSPSGISQEADRVLDNFPKSIGELAEYDAMVAFDPDWTQLTDDQIELLDQWVAEQAGGLVLIAGPVFTPEWTTSLRERQGIRTMKALYPVTFFRRGAMLGRDRFSATSPQPLQLTADGANSRFLWLSDDPQQAITAWDDFQGVYGNYPIRGLKPGAIVLATCQTDAGSDEVANGFMVTQFYGAGRVVYLGSGEMWRLRGLDPAYFESLYTRLIRHASEGRLLRDSGRGLLLVDRDRCLVGETVRVRAILRDVQFRPLDEPEVEVTLKSPSGATQPIRLLPVRDAARGGTYAGQFVAGEEGGYQLQLAQVVGAGLEVLQRDVLVRIPDLEMESPQRNDAALADLAATTRGQYLAGLAISDARLASVFPKHDQETYIPGTPDRLFRFRLLRWLMALLCGCLSLEWLIRRWHRLA